MVGEWSDKAVGRLGGVWGAQDFWVLSHCMSMQYELAFISGIGADGGRVQLSEKAAGPVTAV